MVHALFLSPTFFHFFQLFSTFSNFLDFLDFLEFFPLFMAILGWFLQLWAPDPQKKFCFPLFTPFCPPPAIKQQQVALGGPFWPKRIEATAGTEPPISRSRSECPGHRAPLHGVFPGYLFTKFRKNPTPVAL
jgi:hypothetical protein